MPEPPDPDEVVQAPNEDEVIGRALRTLMGAGSSIVIRRRDSGEIVVHAYGAAVHSASAPDLREALALAAAQ